ncbi:MAG: hypothetical protein KJO95_11030 [Gammaproteobacteria bacterium]|nr:hypothetical protein [Gammaproteobacteria bacterium]MBU2676888.1 hypothetical protein [Gammaproteobacteria bacterium]NNC56699.1 hypothetical protein [Woeseiaceae bacterium]NNL50621.1 hypothetical protein [Woeseiaceae bacterium]
MKKFLTVFLSGGLFLSVGIGFADQHEGAAEEPNVATPVEMFACKYNEGKGPADLDAAVKKFNAWGDKNGINDYSAWTLVPYYAGPEQDFDVLWLGGSEKAKTLGRIQDAWLATGSKGQEAFDAAISCDTHAAYAVLQMLKPPKRDNPSNIVISFSDCNTADGATFDDLYSPIMDWGKYKKEQGSTAGMWVFFPAYGGGGEDFEFKFVAAWQNLEDQGADFDQYSESGWQKAGELFAGKLDCDSSRSYLATNRRMAQDDDE